MDIDGRAKNFPKKCEVLCLYFWNSDRSTYPRRSNYQHFVCNVYGMSECYQKWHNSITCNTEFIFFISDFFPSTIPSLSCPFSTGASLNLRRVDFHHFRTIWELTYCTFRFACRYPYPPSLLPSSDDPFWTSSILSRPLEWMDGLSDYRDRKALRYHDVCSGIDENERAFERAFINYTILFYYEKNVKNAIILKNYIPTTTRHWYKHALNFNASSRIHCEERRHKYQVLSYRLFLMSVLSLQHPLQSKRIVCFYEALQLIIFTLHFYRTVTNKGRK